MTEAEYRKHLEPKIQAIQSKKDLTSFLDEIADHDHDYGTIVIGIAAGMRATFKFLNRNSKHGGITGFQAGCLGWEMIREFMSVTFPCKLVDFNHMLYPQYRDQFEKTISEETWDHLIKEATRLIAEKKEAHKDVVEHWQTIKHGVIPFGYEVVK